MRNEIHSHPNVPLENHLKEVADNCWSIIERLEISATISKEIIKDITYIAGCSHDIGKATKYFQDYLDDPEHKKNGPTNHALISSLLAMYIAQIYVEDKDLSGFNKKALPILVYTSVKRHHGNLFDYDKELILESKHQQELDLQIVSFYDNKVQEILDELLIKVRISIGWEGFKKYIQTKKYDEDLEVFGMEYFEGYESFSFSKFSLREKIQYFYLHQTIYSTLLYSDKSDVILKGLHQLSSQTKLAHIEEFRVLNGFVDSKSSLDELKNEAYLTGLDHLIKIFNKANHLYSITLPTGLGKTITSLAIGLKLKELLNKPAAKLVISIPFTSIIDQNFDVFNNIFQNPSSELLLKHHHLSEPVYKSNEEYDASKSEFLIETWNAEIIVTTFVQLLETLYTNDKRKLLKLPNLSNSIIIIDEVQQIHYDLWNLIRNTFEVLGKQLNCYFILMSATQPLIFEPEKEIIEIIPDYKQYFKAFNRTQLINRTKTEISLEDFVQEVSDYANKYPNKDILIILNTINSTRKCFQDLHNNIDKKGSDIFYLSTGITPYERKRIIKLIKQTGAKRKIIVSTQLIEAGVDISVDTVFRAMAPLDSIIQAAGRANRYGEKVEISEVYLYEISEIKKQTAMIYGWDLIAKTRNIFRNIETISECNYLSLIEAYFKEVKKQSDVIDSRELVSLCNLKFNELGQFQFIEDRKTESVFIQLNEEAQELWLQYEEIYNDMSLNSFGRKDAFSKIKTRFYDYTINVPIQYNETKISFDSEKKFNFYVSDLESPSMFYSYSETDFEVNLGYTNKTVINC